MIDYTIILNKKYAGSEWVLNGDSYEGLTWISESKKPSKAELDKLWPVVQGELEAEKQAKADAKAALLVRLGITEEEARSLLA